MLLFGSQLLCKNLLVFFLFACFIMIFVYPFHYAKLGQSVTICSYNSFYAFFPHFGYCLLIHLWNLSLGFVHLQPHGFDVSKSKNA